MNSTNAVDNNNSNDDNDNDDDNNDDDDDDNNNSNDDDDNNDDDNDVAMDQEISTKRNKTSRMGFIDFHFEQDPQRRQQRQRPFRKLF